MRSGRIRTLLVFMLAIVLGAALVHVSQYVHSLRLEVERKQGAIEQEKAAIKVYEAEWAYLNNPARLEYLVQMYLSDMGVPSAANVSVQEDKAAITPINAERKP